MKTAEEIVMAINIASPPGIEEQIAMIQNYAGQVAKKALEEAYENAEADIEYESHWPQAIIRKESIVNTEIITP